MQEITEQTPEPWPQKSSQAKLFHFAFGCSAKIERMQEQIQPGFNEILSCVGLRGA
jgi:hypothetical protein